MKKIVLIIVVIIGLLAVSGCTKDNVPVVTVTHNSIRDSSFTTEIDKDFYYLDATKEYIDDECVVVIRFKRGNDK